MIFFMFICLFLSLSVVLVDPLLHQVYINAVIGPFFTWVKESNNNQTYTIMSWSYVLRIVVVIFLYFSYNTHISSMFLLYNYNFPPIFFYIWNKFPPIFLYFLPTMWVGDLFLKKNFIDQFFRFEISLPWASK